MSNFYCHPGKAGGFPAYVNAIFQDLTPESRFIAGDQPEARETVAQLVASLGFTLG